MSPAEFVAELKSAGYREVLEREFAGGTVLQEHVHAFDARILVTAGEFTITREGASRTYRAGEIFEVPAGTPHAEACGAETVRYTVGRRPRVGSDPCG